MNLKTDTHLPMDTSIGKGLLLLNPKVTTDIAVAYDSIEAVMLQVQRDLGASTDDELILQVTKGLFHLDQAFKSVAAEGRADLRAAGR